MFAADGVLNLLARSICTNTKTGADELEVARNSLSDALRGARAERAHAELERVLKSHTELTKRIDAQRAIRVAATVRLLETIQHHDEILSNMWRRWAAQRAEILRQQDRVKRASAGGI